jgi:hypothetical protein
MSSFDNRIEAFADQLNALPFYRKGIPENMEDLLLPPSGRVYMDGGIARVAFGFLAMLALTGWSTRMDLVAIVNWQRQRPLASNRYQRVYNLLTQAGLWEVYTTSYRYHPVSFVRLTDKARELLIAADLPITPSEWNVIEASHRRAGLSEQMPHTTAICLFLHYARLRGYSTAACPTGNGLGRAEPDALIKRAGQRIYVEVQRRGGEHWRKMQKWRNQVALQGFSAICAETTRQAQVFAQEAQRHAEAPRGLITDIGTLVEQAPTSLWTHRWRSLYAPLEEITADDARDEQALFTTA